MSFKVERTCTTLFLASGALTTKNIVTRPIFNGVQKRLGIEQIDAGYKKD